MFVLVYLAIKITLVMMVVLEGIGAVTENLKLNYLFGNKMPNLPFQYLFSHGN